MRLPFPFHCHWPSQSCLSHAKASSSLWHGFSFSHLQSLLDFAFLSFHLEDIFYYSHTQNGKASRLSCFVPAYLSHLLRLKAVFERIILSRLLFFLESNCILSPRQAGFRPGRSTLDQILYLSQSISDGFNKPRPGYRTILSTIDFSKAFDSVWHPALFHKLILVGFPACFARWTQSFLCDRRACVVYQNHKSRSFRVRRGVPQGSIFGPVLFSLFINDRPASLPSSVSWSLYADDLAIWSSSPSVSTAVEATQEALFRLERWSEYWCLPLNPSKCEASYFSVDPHQANLQPNLLLLGSRLCFNPTPTFLGVTFDRTLSFSKHVSSLKGKFFPRLKALRCISASSWGPSKESLSVLYKSFLRSLFTYASPGWFPFLSVNNITKLERLHLAASRAITSCLSSSPIPLLLSKASLPSLRVTLTHFTLLSYERAIHLPTSFPISGLARLGVKPRLCRSSWRAFASNELARWGALLAPSAIPCSLSPLISRIHSCLFSDWRRTGTSKFFDTQVPSISTEELVLPRHARCALSRLRCNGHSRLGFYVSRIGRIENPSCSACGHSSQDTSHLILHCPATASLRRSLFGDCLSLYDL